MNDTNRSSLSELERRLEAALADGASRITAASLGPVVMPPPAVTPLHRHRALRYAAPAAAAVLVAAVTVPLALRADRGAGPVEDPSGTPVATTSPTSGPDDLLSTLRADADGDGVNDEVTLRAGDRRITVTTTLSGRGEKTSFDLSGEPALRGAPAAFPLDDVGGAELMVPQGGEAATTAVLTVVDGRLVRADIEEEDGPGLADVTLPDEREIRALVSNDRLVTVETLSAATSTEATDSRPVKVWRWSLSEPTSLRAERQADACLVAAEVVPCASASVSPSATVSATAAADPEPAAPRMVCDLRPGTAGFDVPARIGTLDRRSAGQPHSADVDGDGRADALRVEGQQVVIELADGRVVSSAKVNWDPATVSFATDPARVDVNQRAYPAAGVVVTWPSGAGRSSVMVLHIGDENGFAAQWSWPMPEDKSLLSNGTTTYDGGQRDVRTFVDGAGHLWTSVATSETWSDRQVFHFLRWSDAGASMEAGAPRPFVLDSDGMPLGCRTVIE